MADTVQRIYQLIIDAGGSKQGADLFAQAMGQIDTAGQNATRTLAQWQRASDAQERRIDPVTSKLQAMSRELQLVAEGYENGGLQIDKAQQKVEQITLKYDAAARAAASFARAFATGNTAAVASLNQSSVSDAAELYSKQFQAQTNQFAGVRIGPSYGLTAEQSAAAFRPMVDAEERLQAFAAKYEPLTVATQRYTQAVAANKAMLDAGEISELQYAKSLQVEQEMLDATTAADKRRNGGGFGGGIRSIGGMELQASAINFVQGVASGISPLRMLETEGTQVFGAFAQDAKGATAALTGMWSTLVKFAPAIGIIGGIAGAVGTVATAFFKGRAEVEAFIQAVKLSGNAAGVTRGSFEGLVSSLDKISNLGPATIRAIGTEMVGTGKLATPVIAKLISMTEDYAKATGQDAAKAGAALAKTFSDPKSAMQQLDDQYNLLDAAERRNIQNLILQGDKTGAQIALADALNSRLHNLSTDGLGWLERAWNSVSHAASDAWDSMKNIGRGETLEELLADAKRNATGAGTGSRFAPGSSMTKTQANAEVSRIEGLIASDDLTAKTNAQAAALREQGKSAQDLADQYGGAAKQSTDLGNQLAGMQKYLADVNAEMARLDGSDGAGANKVFGDMADNAKNAKTAVEALANAKRIADRTPLMEAQDRLNIDQQVNAASPTQRAALRARLTAQYNASYSSDIRVGGDANKGVQAQLGNVAATQALSAETTAVRDQNTQLDLNARLTLATGEAWMKSSTEGAMAAARQQASIEALTQPINVNARAAQILTQQVNDSIAAGAQQVRSLDDQVTAQQRLAAAAKDGPLSEHQAEVTNQIAAATKDYNDKLQLAISTGNTKAAANLKLEIAGIAEKTKQADEAAVQAARSLQFFTSMEDQGYQKRLLQTQLDNVFANDNQQTKALAMEQAEIDIMKMHYDLNSKEADAYRKNAAAIADMTVKLNEQKAIAAELPNAFNQAFDRIGEAVTQFAVQGGDAFKSLENIGNAVFSELLQEGLKLALINPVKNWFNGDNALPTMNAVADHLFGTNFSGGGGISAGNENAAAGVMSAGGGSWLSGVGSWLGGVGSSVGSWLGSFFADGGVMTSHGKLPLRTYSAGGITSSPQLAMFGEGSTPEAYVPVPSGKIPVEMKMLRPNLGNPANSNGQMVVNQHLHFHTKEAVDQFRRSPGQTMNAAYRGLQAAGGRNG